MLSDPKLQPYVEEIARRFAASYISVHTGTAFATMYRKLKDKHPGKLWIALARMAIEQAQAGAAESPDIDLEELDSNNNSTSWALRDVNGPPPTPQQFLTVLSNLTSLRIRGEYVNGADKGAIDNVYREAAAASVPEPATFAPAGLVLGVLCAGRGSKRAGRWFFTSCESAR